MVEQKIEQKIIEKLTSALQGAGVQRFLVTGRLSANENTVKGLESSENDVIIVVKTSPRSYSTATIPTCQLNYEVNCLVRADVDYSGMTYLGVTDALIDVFQRWQRCYDDTHADFTLPDEFRCAGFQLGTGEFGLDQTGKVWNYNHALTVFGVLENDYTTTNN